MKHAMSLRNLAILIWSGFLVVLAIIVIFQVGASEVGFTLSSVLFVVVGAFLTVKVPQNRIGTVMLIGGSAWLIYTAAGEYAQLSIRGTSPLPAEHLAAWLGAWSGALLPSSIAALVLLFPDGRLSRMQKALLGAITIPALFAIVGAIALWNLSSDVLIDTVALDQASAYGAVDLAFILGFIAVIPATATLVGRFRHGNPTEKQQIKLFLASAGLFGVFFIAVAVSSESGTSDRFWPWAMTLSIGLLPITVAIAVARYRLYDIDRILSRTVSYAIVAGLLGLLFLGLVTLFALFLPSDDPLVVAGSTLGVAAVFDPVRRRVLSLVERRFNRSRYDAERVMHEFAGSLRDRHNPDEVVAGWVDVVEGTMRPTSLSVWVRP